MYPGSIYGKAALAVSLQTLMSVLRKANNYGAYA